MIREATKEDIPQIVKLGRRALVDGPYAKIIKDVPTQTAKFAEQIIRTGKVLLWLNESNRVVGLVAFYIFPHPFTGEQTATEIMLYMEPEERPGGGGLKLMWAAEEEAKKMGATYMGFTAPDPTVGSLYRRFGYEQLEVTYMKEL